MAKHVRRKDKRKGMSPDLRVPSDVAELACREVLDLTRASKFCMRQAENAAIFSEGVEQRPHGRFVLKSPFRENFIGTLFAYVYPDADFNSADTIANALPRHAELYLGAHKIDRIRSRFIEEMSEPLKPAALRGSFKYWEGLITENGEFCASVEKQGTPAILAFQEVKGDYASLALEVRGRAVGNKDPKFRRTLLTSVLKEALLKLRLQQPQRGRPHDANKAERIAYARDHQRLQHATVATQFCDCGQSRHVRRCFDRLDSLADSFYSVQRSRLEKMVKKSSPK